MCVEEGEEREEIRGAADKWDPRPPQQVKQRLGLVFATSVGTDKSPPAVLLLDAVQFRISAICYSLAAELAVFLLFFAKAIVNHYPSHKCDCSEQFTSGELLWRGSTRLLCTSFRCNFR